MRSGAILQAGMALFLGATQAATAGSYDGSQPFTCAPVNIVSCGSDGQCGKESADTVDLPPVLKFDVAKNAITGKRSNGEALTAAIDKVVHVEDRMILEGTDAGTMWGVMIVETSGNMTLTVGGDRVGFVGFGTCAPD